MDSQIENLYGYGFYIIIRNGSYYARFFDKRTGNKIADRSIRLLAKRMGITVDTAVGGRKKRNQIESIVREYQTMSLNEGSSEIKNKQKQEKQKIKENKDIPLVIDFVFDFWDFNGQRVTLINKKKPNSIGRTSCYNQLHNFNKHLKDYFESWERLDRVTSKRLNEIQDNLIESSGLSNATISKIMQSIVTPMNYAFEQQIIDFRVKLDKIDITGKEKGFLSVKEVSSLVRVFQNWELEGKEDTDIRLGIVLAALTAMRQGEIRALRSRQISMIDEKQSLICINRSWSRLDKEKSTKGKRNRKITVPTVLAKGLLERASRNPFNDDRVFWSTTTGSNVIDGSTLRKKFYKALEAIGIPEKERKKRNIVYHSLRHGFVSLIGNQVDDLIFRKAIGHQSREMTEHYTHLSVENLKIITDSVSNTFRNVINAEEKIENQKLSS